jgi:hypothetical protein
VCSRFDAVVEPSAPSGAAFPESREIKPMDQPNRVLSNDDQAKPLVVRARWEQPSITELPKLTDLTLLTGSGIPGGGGTGGGGSTVF